MIDSFVDSSFFAKLYVLQIKNFKSQKLMYEK